MHSTCQIWSRSDSNQRILWNSVVQYVLREEQQILVCETSTIYLLSVACLSKTKQRELIVEKCIRLPAWWGVFLIKPQQDALQQPQGVQAFASWQFVCTFGAKVSPRAMSFSRKEMGGMVLTPKVSCWQMKNFSCTVTALQSKHRFFLLKKKIYLLLYLHFTQETPDMNGCLFSWLERGHRSMSHNCCVLSKHPWVTLD